MSEFGGLRKHEKTQHALVGLGSAALMAWLLQPYLGKAVQFFFFFFLNNKNMARIGLSSLESFVRTGHMYPIIFLRKLKLQSEKLTG